MKFVGDFVIHKRQDLSINILHFYGIFIIFF